MSAERSRKDYLWLAAIVAILLTAVFVVRANAGPITRFIDHNPILGICLYIGLNVLDAVFAPGATLPLIPVAAHAWGRVPAALVTIFGWTLGSLIAFGIARRWGYPIVRKVTSMKRLREMKPYIPKNMFWGIVLLRLVLPMDVISYVLGLFTEMPAPRYMMATAIGVAPSAFLLAYLGKLPHAYDIITIGIAAAAVAGYILIIRRRHRRADS